jgi:F0F1-type ATP synthase membrane subunit c/vacuolar-type H+-ATPase subunit K
VIAPPAPDDWSALDVRERREALGALKAQLRERPEDLARRSEVVRAYRQLGHLDQAGRFAIGLEEGARTSEIQAYAWMLHGLRADESAARRLSLISSDVELPEQLTKVIEGGPVTGEWRAWGVYVGIAWGASVVLALTSMAVAYGFAMVGASNVESIAQSWTLVTGWVLVVAVVVTTLWCVTSAKRTPALVWTCTTVVVIGFVLLATLAMLR